MALLASAEPPERLGDAVGGWVATIAAATIGLTLIGGAWVAEVYGWRYTMLVVPAVSAVLLIILRFTLPETAKVRKRGNPLAMAVLAVAMITLVLGLSLAAH